MPAPRSSRSRRLVGLAGLVVPAVLLVALAAVWAPRWSSPATGQSGGARPRATGNAPERVVAADAVPARRHGAVAAEPPRQVRLPDGVLVPVRAVSTRRNGLLDVPSDIRTAGWWRGGSRLGDPWGATLVAAHVDSATQGLGPYAALLGVRPGQRVQLASAHLRQDFRIDSLRLVPQGSLSGESWIHGVGGRRRLVLVTCAPPYDRSRGGYQNLAVVTALPAGPPAPRRTP